MTSTQPQTLLKQVFGYDTFKPLQREVIDNVLQKRDTLAVMPTGGGKSLCYQLPALIFPGLTVVVSPLIALMKDQVDQMRELGVPAVFLNSSLAFPDYAANMERVRQGQVRLLYVAPETLLTPRLFDLLAKVKPDCLTIDEAHCISEWGHDFRPEYRQLVAVRNRFPEAVCLALTATATPRVRQDIKTSLHFADSNEFVASFNRENLLIEVQAKRSPTRQTLQFLERFKDQAGIIYCFSRQGAENLAETLAHQGYAARPYHAGLDEATRFRNQEAFIRDDIQIIVATIAFGMGINKPNVRFIIHSDLPKSIEGYYQEMGRAGRDGLPATCLLLYSYGDVHKQRHFIDQKDEQGQLAANQQLQALTRYAESDVCRRRPLLAYFGETYTTENCGMCDNCLGGQKTQVDITIPAQKFLSCVKRAGERFGASHIVDVLLGSENQKVLKFEHQNLSTYGIGKDLSRNQWLHIGRQLVQKGLLELDEQHSTLSLTPQAVEILRARTPIFGQLQAEALPAPAARQAGEIEHDPALFDRLRQTRKALAEAAGLPPYVIFSDRTLVEMAAYYPQSEASLLQISGVGQVKLEHYGQAFLTVITAYCQERGLAERPRSTPKRERSTQASAGGRQDEVGEAFNAGYTLAQLAERYQVQLTTILDHLTRFAQDGHPLRRSDEFLAASALSEDQKQAGLQAFASLGAERLRPVFDALGEAVNYDELKLLRLYYLSQP